MTKSPSKSRHPKELFILSFAELCERFTFWGIGNLLVLYLVQYYKMPNAHATSAYGIFTGCAAALPLLGGFIADRWNYRHPMIIGALVNALGALLIAFGQPHLLYIALVLIALGYGLFTPSILTLLGNTYHEVPHLREAGFSIYYASINVGVFLAMISLGWVVQKFGWSAGFILASAVQLCGLIPIFVYLKKHHGDAKVKHPSKSKTPKEPLKSYEKQRIVVLLIFAVVSILFWMNYSQGFSSMSLFSLHYIDRTLGSFEIPTPWILSSESFFLIVLAPILATLYGYLQKKKRDPSATVKTSLGLISMALCFLIMVIASFKIPHGAKSAQISFGFPILAYFLMAIGEMLLAPIGLSLITRLATRRFTALLVGFWYVCVGIAFFLGGQLAGLMGKLHALSDFFLIFVFTTAIPGILLWIFAKKINKMKHIEKLSEAAQKDEETITP